MSERTSTPSGGSAVTTPPPGKKSRVRATPKGRRVDPQARADVQALLGDAPRRRDLLIEFLHLIQDRYKCLSTPHLAALAAELKMAMAEVYEVATFYHHFDVVKEGDVAPPPITVRVCDSIACDLAGSHEILKKLTTALGTDIRVLHAPCVGRCETAPVAVVGQNPIPYATAEQVVEVVRRGHVTHPRADESEMHPHFATVTPGHIDYAAYREAGGYALAAACVKGERTVEDVTAIMEHSGLRGLGGAGFPTGRKWKLVAAEPAPRLMAINIDEGEPGTFKDRYYLERDPHRFLEGLLVAAQVVGTESVYIYLRDEYHGCPRRDDRAFEEAMRVAFEVVAILERARLAFVDVDRHQARRRFGGHQLPLAPGRESGPAEAAQPRAFHHRGDIRGASLALHARRCQRVAAGGAIRGVVDVAGCHRREVRVHLGFVHARMRDVPAADDVGHLFRGGVRNRILADDRDRRRLAASDARCMQDADVFAEHRRQPVEEIGGPGQVAGDRVTDPHGDRRRGRLALLHHVEVVVESRDLVNLGHRHLQLSRQRNQVRRGEAVIAVLNQVQVLD